MFKCKYITSPINFGCVVHGSNMSIINNIICNNNMIDLHTECGDIDGNV